MSERNNKLELLGSAPIPKALMALGIPIMIGMLINALYNLVDAYFVGGLGESQMGAISVVFPLGQVVVGLGLMFGNGAASYLSRLLGRGDKDTANRVASTALYSSILIGAIIILFSTIFLKPILAMLGATETIMPYALTYARIYVLSCIFNVFNVTMNNIVSSEGAAKTTMCALLLGAVLNIGLDPLFIYTLNMGVAGAAIATAISQMVSTLVYLTYVLRKKSAFSFSVKVFSPTGQMMAEILKIGIPTLVFQLLTSLSIALINRASGDYGDSVIAGMGAVTRITSMGTLVVFGFLKGFQPILFTPDTEKWETQQTGTVTTCGGNLNVRTGAGLDNDAFTQLPDGAQVEVIGTEGEWVKVLLPEREGYVHSDYLTITDTGSFSLSLDGTDLSALLELFASGLSGGGGAALTPDGNLSLIDDLGGTSSGKQFITVETKGGNVFYLIIDRDDEGAQTVHFLNQVDEADLLALMEDGEAQEAPAVCTCTEKCQAGAVNTSCEVCAVNMAECAGAEPEPEPEPEPEAEKSGGMGALALVLALVVLGGGGAFAYIKFIRPKQASKVSADPDDYDFADEEEYINEDEPEPEEEMEDTK